jgi:hypothetical protein
MTDCLSIVLGDRSLARYPQGGAYWMMWLQYLLGLRDLGHDVLLMELFQSPDDPARRDELIDIFFDRLGEYDLRDNAVILLYREDPPTIDRVEALGERESDVKKRLHHADLLWNFAGAVRQPLLSLFKHKVFIDGDPGHVQVSALNYDFHLTDHDALLTVGSKMNDADCEVPRLGLAWQTFVPPIYPPLWEVGPNPGPDAPFTSVTHWTWEEVWLNGRILSTTKRDGYLRYLDLPKRAKAPFELAANIHPKDTTGDREMLIDNGWGVVDPWEVVPTPKHYQDYLLRSRGEICCVKPIFRELKTGWFSERSASYLASGRPVLEEETGFTDHYPSGEGIVAFTSMDEAVAGVEEINSNYDRHSKAAREIAEEYFNSRRTLEPMLTASFASGEV